MADPALILSMGHIQGVVRPILDAPTLLLQVQPVFLIQLSLGSRGHQPGLIELAFGPNATINPGDLQCSSQTEFLGFNRSGDDGSVLLACAPIAGLFQYRGEGPPAGVAGRFGAGWAGYPGGSGCNRRLGHRGSDARFGVGCASHPVAQSGPGGPSVGSASGRWESHWSFCPRPRPPKVAGWVGPWR